MKLSIVIPCYNEADTLPNTLPVFLSTAQALHETHGIEVDLLLVDDGSIDGSWQQISETAQTYSQVHALKLAHNVGHQRALWAGLEWAETHSDAAISIDADLQDDVSVMHEMVARWKKGDEIVYGVRDMRQTDTVFKRHSAQFFYRTMRYLGGDILYNHADFRLMSKRALAALMMFPERNLFLRGMVHSLGFSHSIVRYARSERNAGQSKYPLKRMLAFAIDGITSFSIRPIRFIAYLGILFMLVAIAAIIYGVVAYYRDRVVPGWTSLIVSIWFVGGALLLAVGIVGEYVGKIYSEVKRRPHYFIEKEI